MPKDTKTQITYTITADLPEGDYQVLATYSTGDTVEGFGVLDELNIGDYTDSLLATYDAFYTSVSVDKMVQTRVFERVRKGKRAQA